MRSLSTAELFSRYPVDESDVHDFKEDVPRAGRLQEPLVAFANTAGGAVVIGVSNVRPRSVVGVLWGEGLASTVQDAASSTHPPLLVTTEPFDVGGRTVVVVTVPRVVDRWAQTSDGRLLIRTGPRNRALVGDDLRRFLLARGSESVDRQVVPDATTADLDPPAVRAYLRTRLGRVPRRIDDGLRDLGFLDPEGGVRVACLLLFGKAPQRLHAAWASMC